MDWIKDGHLYIGDNLKIMREMPSKSIDLCYIDPPFFSKRIQGHGQKTFSDKKEFFEEESETGAKGFNAYSEWMKKRLIEIHRLLKLTGSFYCHLDKSASHYIKVMLDEIFGRSNFKNEIIWRRKSGTHAGVAPRNYSTNTDTILFYTKTKNYTYTQQYLPSDPDYIKKNYRHDDNNGRGKYKKENLGALGYRPNSIYSYKGYQPPERGWRVNKEKMEKLDEEGRLAFPKNKAGRIQRKVYLSGIKGKAIENIWTDIKMISASSKERTGWPTQKPVALLERIINSSSKEGDLVFDPFIGAGTTARAAEKLNRRWVGIELSPEAGRLARESLGEGTYPPMSFPS